MTERRRFAAVMLTERLGLATTTEVEALGRHRSRVPITARYLDDGAEVRGESERREFVRALTRASSASTMSNRKVSEAVGLSEGTIRKASESDRG